jgi:GntP family gluconate:H+ symporter
LPLVIWLVAAALFFAMIAGLPAHEIVARFNTAFGRALGEFALILLPAFALAACVAGFEAPAAASTSVVVSPLAAAAMACPDTAYVALSPIAAHRRLSVAFGSYAGFKLLLPAGPLIVGSGMGLSYSPLLLGLGITLLAPVWLAGEVWARLFVPASRPASVERGEGGKSVLGFVAPFLSIFGLLGIGLLFGPFSWSAIDFLASPKGALLAAALFALVRQPPGRRRECLEIAVRRTGALLLIIGAASAFGAALAALVPVAGFAVATGDAGAVVAIFLAAAAFKLLQGSSMATFAAVAPAVAPLAAAGGISPEAAVFAACTGSLFAIVPNDSFYWVVRRDALEETSGRRAALILIGGSGLQAIVGLIVLLALVLLDVV